MFVHRRRPRAGHGAGDRGDHGLAAAGKAGVGSAVNDTARELGGTLGVAILGSLFVVVYGAKLGRGAVRHAAAEAGARRRRRSSVGGAEVVAHQAGVQGGPQAESVIHAALNQSFVDGWHAGSWVCFGVVLVGALVAWRWLPSTQSGQEPDTQSGQDPMGSHAQRPGCLGGPRAPGGLTRSSRPRGAGRCVRRLSV